MDHFALEALRFLLVRVSFLAVAGMGALRFLEVLAAGGGDEEGVLLLGLDARVGLVGWLVVLDRGGVVGRDSPVPGCASVTGGGPGREASRRGESGWSLCPASISGDSALDSEVTCSFTMADGEGGKATGAVSLWCDTFSGGGGEGVRLVALSLQLLLEDRAGDTA